MGYRTIVLGFAAIMLVSILKLGLLMHTDYNKFKNLSHRQIRQDVLVLLREIEQHSAFYSMDAIQLRKKLNLKISQLGQDYPNQIPIERFTADIARVMALLADPSVSVRPLRQTKGVLPIVLRPAGEQWLALDHDSQALAPNYPFISHIDNIPLATWVTASRRYLPSQLHSSVQMHLPWLHQLNLLRYDIGLPLKEHTVLTLTNNQGATSQLSLPIGMPASEHIPSPKLVAVKAKIPQSSIPADTQILKIDDISIYNNSQSARTKLHQAMLSPQLILDMRQATGFSDWFIATLGKYDRVHRLNRDFMGFGRHRISPMLRNDYLRPMNYVRFDQLSHTNTRQAIRITQGIDNTHGAEFSQWFARTVDFEPGFYVPLNNRLTLLIGPSCRQDCQWLAHYAKTWPNAILVGQATSGYLARQHYFELPQSGLKINMSASLSYDNQGRRVTGLSTQPDITLAFDEYTDWPAFIGLIKDNQERKQKLAGITAP